MNMARALISSSLVVAASSGAPVQAAAWSVSEQASITAGYDDNVLLSTSDAKQSANASGTLSAHIARQSDVFALSIEPRWVAVRYADYSVLDRDEQYLTLAAQQQTERGSGALSLQWTRDTTLTSELGTTGITQVNKRHDSLALTLSKTLQWSERWDTTTQLYAARNRYMDHAIRAGLVDYNYGVAQLGVGYALTMSSQLSLSASTAKLQVPDFRLLDKRNDSVTLDYSIALAQRWQAKFSFGPSRVRSTFDNEQGTVYAVSVARQSELSTVRVNISRDVTPTGQGALTRRQQVNLNFTRALSERTSLTLGATWIHNNNLRLADNQAVDDVRYTDLNASVDWRVAPTWTLSLGAGHAEQRAATAAQYATRNRVSLNMTWSGLEHNPRHWRH